MQHSIWKMYSTIHNGLLARKKSVLHPQKSICVNVLKVMYKEGYINGFRKLPNHPNKIEIFLKSNLSSRIKNIIVTIKAKIVRYLSGDLIEPNPGINLKKY